MTTQPTIRNGSRGDAVKLWQRVLGPPIVDDGIFGPKTLAATKEWQYSRGLAADGIVGPKTWGAAEREDEVETIYEYIRATDPVSGAATSLKSEFIVWYQGMNPITRALEETRQEAVNRRNAFDVANVRSSEQLEKVKEKIEKKPPKEELKKKKKKTDDAGNYPREEGTTVASASKSAVPDTARPTLRKGSKGEAVKVWQKILGHPIVVDGKFGKLTHAATKQWQKERGLVADGIVGTATWTEAFDNSAPVPISHEKAATTKVAGTKKKPKQVPAGVVIPLTITAKAPKKNKKKKKKNKPVSDEDMKKAATPAETDEELVGISQSKVKKLVAAISLGAGTGMWGIIRLIK